ncbi:hypothetical protein ES703_102964 [subsurface metagenome]
MIKSRHTVRYCDLCRRQTCHTSIDYGMYRCDNCTSGVCLTPAGGPMVYRIDDDEDNQNDKIFK